MNAESHRSILNVIRVALLVVSFTVASCGKSASDVPASQRGSRAVTTEQREGGARTVREATEGEASAVNFLAAANKRVDEKYPAPRPDKDMALFGVSQVNPDGTIALQRGPIVRLDGVRCSAEGLRTIGHMFESDRELKLGWIREASDANPIPVEAWLVEGSTTQSFSRLQDVAITSGWCEPQRTNTSKSYDRYVALANVRAEYVKRFGADRNPSCDEGGTPRSQLLAACSR